MSLLAGDRDSILESRAIIPDSGRRMGTRSGVYLFPDSAKHFLNPATQHRSLDPPEPTPAARLFPPLLPRT